MTIWTASRRSGMASSGVATLPFAPPLEPSQACAHQMPSSSCSRVYGTCTVLGWPLMVILPGCLRSAGACSDRTHAARMYLRRYSVAVVWTAGDSGGVGFFFELPPRAPGVPTGEIYTGGGPPLVGGLTPPLHPPR